MDGAFLAVTELRQEDGVDGSAENGSLDHRARVEAHNRVCVVQRVEIVRLRPCIGGELYGWRPTGDVREIREVHATPLSPAPGVRSDENAAVLQHGMAALPQFVRPSHDKRRLGRTVLEKR